MQYSPIIELCILQEDSTLDYRCAYLNSIEEYNNFGQNVINAKHRIDKSLANLMYGFKAETWGKQPYITITLLFALLWFALCFGYFTFFVRYWKTNQLVA